MPEHVCEVDTEGGRNTSAVLTVCVLVGRLVLLQHVAEPHKHSVSLLFYLIS